MKRFKLFAVLVVLLAIASIGYAEKKSSTASPTQQNPYAATAPDWGWACPMWGWGPGPGNQAKGAVTPYGPMGPGMYYYGPANPAQNQSGNGSFGSGGQQQPLPQ